MAVQIDGSQGNVIATKGTYSGSVSIGGTLTYEDVTNIDSVGIITARTSIEVGARPGVGASISSDGNAIFSGITTITQLGGSPKLTSGQTITSTANDGNASIQGGLTYPGGHIRLGGGSGDDDIRFSVSGGSGTLSEKARITSGGDLTLGNTSVAFPSGTGLQVYHASAPRIKLTNSTSGVAAADGFQIYTSGAAAFLDNKENGEMRFYTNATEKARIDTSGRLLVGATAKRNVLNQNGNSGGDSVTPYFYAEGTGDSKALTLVSNNTNAWRGSVLGLARTRGTSVGDSTIIQDDDNIGQIVFAGGDGTDIECNAATIKADIDGTPGANDMPGRLVFSTTADGAVVSTERLRINSAGNMGLGESSISPVGGTYKAFDIAYQGTGLSGRTDNPTLDLRSNLYYDGSNWKYGDGSTTGGVLHVGGNQLMFYAAPSGTAGNTATLTHRARIDGSGNFLFNTDSTSSNSGPGFKLYPWASGADNWGAWMAHVIGSPTGTNTPYYLYNTNATNNGHRFSIRVDGGINNHSGNNSNLSDRREKKDIEDLSSTWEAIKQWRLRKFHFKDVPEDATEYDKNYGVIAQEIEEISPEVGRDWEKQPEKKDDDGNIIQEQVMRRSVREQKIMWMAIKALQEAQTKIETLESEMAALKSS